MPKLDTESIFTKRAYYFGVIALISFLVARGLIGVQKITATQLPVSLLIVISIVSVFSGIACIYSSYKGREELFSFKKTTATFLAFGAFVYIVLIIRDVIRYLTL